MTNKILVFVGMPGSGKSQATLFLKKKGIPFVRFGQLTDDTLKERGIPQTTENEKIIREEMRQKFGMAAYAIFAKPKIEVLLKAHNTIAVDGLYSWEEYVFLKKDFPGLILIHIYVERERRYERLAKRPIRPVALSDCYGRDVAEIEKLNKGGPISIADYCLDNNDDNIEKLYEKIDVLLEILGVAKVA